MNNSKRSCSSAADLNNNEIISSSSTPKKKKKSIVTSEAKQVHTIGQIKELRMLNFMCHKNFSIEFRALPMQIVTGANGSGKLRKKQLVSFFNKIIFSRKINNSKCHLYLFGCSSTNNWSNIKCSIIYS
jgi:hypothetical protein